MTPNEIHNKQFDKAMSGYKPEDVSAYLADVANYVEKLIEEKLDLEQKLLVLAEKLEEYREDEDSLRAALIGAQKLGDSVVRESKRKAEEILAEAQQKADTVVADIKKNINRETDTLNKMQAEVARFKSQILASYKQHIEMVNMIPYDEKDFPQQPSNQPEVQAKPEAVNPVPKTEHTHQAQPQPTLAKAAKPAPVVKDFVVTLEDDLEYEDVPDETTVKRESRHGDLLFGDKYPLTRKD